MGCPLAARLWKMYPGYSSGPQMDFPAQFPCQMFCMFLPSGFIAKLSEFCENNFPGAMVSAVFIAVACFQFLLFQKKSTLQ